MLQNRTPSYTWKNWQHCFEIIFEQYVVRDRVISFSVEEKKTKALRLMCCPVWWQVDSVEAVLELCGFISALLQGLVSASEEHWRAERVGLLLQLLCACQRCLSLNGDCRPLLILLQKLLPVCQQVTQQSLWSNNILDYYYFIFAMSELDCSFVGAAVGWAVNGRSPAPARGPCSSAEWPALSG